MPSVLLLRHALSTWNVDGLWQGQADPPLSPEGEAQARAAAGAVGPVDLVVTSDLERARRTGAILAPGVEAAAVPELREFDVGEWSGRTRAEIEAEWPGEIALFDARQLVAPPGGEDRDTFDDRVRAGVEQVAGLIRSRRSERSLVVTHGGVIRSLARIQGWPEHHVAQLAGYEAEVEGKGATLALRRPISFLDATVNGRRPIDEQAL
jgi:broad specificity phosphatase PhoE